MADGNCSSGQPVSVSRSHGYLASVVTEQTQLGSEACPWLISTQRGQTVSVTLHDFGVWRHNSTSAALQPASASSVSYCVPAPIDWEYNITLVIYSSQKAAFITNKQKSTEHEPIEKIQK